MADVNKIVMEEIEKQAGDPEQADRMKSLFEGMAQIPLPSMNPTAVNMYEMTIALCAASFCIGKDPMSVNAGQIRSTALMLAKNLFHEDGTFIP